MRHHRVEWVWRFGGALLLALGLIGPFMPAIGQDETPTTNDAEQAASVETELRRLALELDVSRAGDEAVAALVALGDERVKPILERLMDRSLYRWEGQVVFAPETVPSEAGEDVAPLRDLLTGEPILGPDSAPVTMSTSELMSARHQGSRAARRAAKDALSVIDLMSRNAAVRETAAKRVGDARDAAALPRLREMAESDPDSRARRTAAESMHLIIASGADPKATTEQKLASIEVLGDLASRRARSLIELALAEPALAGLDAEVLEPVATEALRKIERRAAIVRWLSYSFQGLSAGSILILLALGLAITFGVMGVINMAHGEMLMIGAVTTWACYEFITPVLPAGWGNWYYVAALPLSFLVAAGVGLLIEALIVRHLYKRPLDSLLATIGVSFALIQAVRMWKGDNLGMSAPTWFTGGWEVMYGVSLPYNRLFVIGLTACCVAATAAMFRFTRLGLMIRATVQDRETAQSLGVNTRFVDMATFAYGAGLAGLAGYAIVLLSNPTPEMGQGYIVKSFLVVVVGGVGQLLGVVVSGLGIGFMEKLIEPLRVMDEPIRIFDATWAQVAVLIIVAIFIQRRPSGLFPEKGRLADRPESSGATSLAGRGDRRVDVAMGVSLAVLGLLVVPMLYASGFMAIETVNKLGYFVAFATVAVGLDLIWGYTGVLSLCQFLFFAIGGYAMGLYLVNHGPKDAYGIPQCLAYVMSDVTNPTAPWFLPLFETFGGAVFLGVLLPGLLALLIGVTTFRSRVRGVYFAILTQAITVGFWLVFQKNDLKLGGTNGLTKFDTILGFPIANQADAGAFGQTRFWLYIASVLTLLLVLVVAKLLVNSGFGRVLIAIRDDETRLLFRGYRAWVYKAAAFTIAAVFAAIGGMLYVPQKGIITPHQIAAMASIMVVVWVALGGRGTLWGAAIGALAVNLLYDWLTSRAPELWPFVLGGLFIAVPLFLPGGLMSLPGVLWSRLGRLRAPRPIAVSTQAPAGGATLSETGS